MTKAFRASRYGRGEQEEGDYINCMLDRAQYEHFVAELVKAERIPLESFEAQIDQGVKAGRRHPRGVPAGGDHRPARCGLPATAPCARWGSRPGHRQRPHAVLQPRQDNLAGTCYNMVGFQTNLRFPEQKRVFGLIPGLENAEFLRYGQMHRNTFVNAPQLLDATLRFRGRPDLFMAGSITGSRGTRATSHRGAGRDQRGAADPGESLLTLPVEPCWAPSLPLRQPRRRARFSTDEGQLAGPPLWIWPASEPGNKNAEPSMHKRRLRVLSDLTHGAAQIQDRLFLQGGPSGPAAQPL